MKPSDAMLEQELAKQRAKADAAYGRIARCHNLYALKLENDRYYVGRTFDVARRIDEHRRGEASHWTHQHRYLALIETRPCKSLVAHEAELEETLWTLAYMQRFGWKNVRGGYFCSPDEAFVELELRRRRLFDEVNKPALRSR